MPKPVAIVWFREDLRLTDNSALAAAIEHGFAVLPVYIFDEKNLRAPGGASRWWLHHSLHGLQQALETAGGELLLFQGDSKMILEKLCAANSAAALYFSRSYDPQAAALESEVNTILGKGKPGSVAVKRFSGSLLFEPDKVVKSDGTPYKVFSPFYKRCLGENSPARPGRTLSADDWASSNIKDSVSLLELNLLPKIKWDTGLQENWEPGEQGAYRSLQSFIETALEHYASDRDVPGVEGTSKLSPHLHFGEISPRVIWFEVEKAAAANPKLGKGAAAYLRELVWRDFCYYLLHHWPALTTEPFKEQYKAFPWQHDDAVLRAWQTGQTGYPLVDAGMRQLWQTGWMHNRVRMVVASFLVKHLLQHWQQGESWFWDTLVDADQANNIGGWQWAAGCGADAAPYFRIFNPSLQGEKFDPDGAYTRHYVPELAKIPRRYLYEPFKAPEAVLREAGITLGVDYPEPIVEHRFARERALQAMKSMPGKPGNEKEKA